MPRRAGTMPTLEGEALEAEAARLQRMTVRQLQSMARRNNLLVRGTKMQLIARLTGRPVPETPVRIRKLAVRREFPQLAPYEMPGENATREELIAGFEAARENYRERLQACRDWLVAYRKAHQSPCRDGMNRFFSDNGMPLSLSTADYNYRYQSPAERKGTVIVADNVLSYPYEDFSDAGLRRQLQHVVDGYEVTMNRIRERGIQERTYFRHTEDSLNEAFRAMGVAEYHIPQKGSISINAEWAMPHDAELDADAIDAWKESTRAAITAFLAEHVQESKKDYGDHIRVNIRRED